MKTHQEPGSLSATNPNVFKPLAKVIMRLLCHLDLTLFDLKNVSRSAQKV